MDNVTLTSAYRNIVQWVMVNDCDVVLVLEVTPLDNGRGAVVVGEEGRDELTGPDRLPPSSILTTHSMPEYNQVNMLLMLSPQESISISIMHSTGSTLSIYHNKIVVITLIS